MYFHESEAIAREHLDLQRVMKQVDEMLATIFTSAPLRPADFSLKLECDSNQVIAIFDLLVGRELLNCHEMVECERCQNLMSAAAFREAREDEDEFDCSSCGRPFRRSVPVTSVYRMSPETLARPKPAVPTADIEAALGELDRSARVIRRLGQVWVLKYGGQVILMQDVRGLSYLARLLAEPRRTIPAASLLAAVAGIDARITAGSSGPLLTGETLANYKQRYAELQEELEEAQSQHDLGRIAKAQSDMETFGTEIARATGLGGKRRERTDVEKIRKSVSMAVTRAIDSIRNEYAALGQHLRNSISPGLSFCYSPEPLVDWLT